MIEPITIAKEKGEEFKKFGSKAKLARINVRKISENKAKK